MQPFIELFIWSLLLALVTALLYRFLTKPAEMRAAKQAMSELREKANRAQKAGDTKQASVLMSEMMKSNQKVFRMNMKPMMASMVIFFVVLGWLAATFETMAIALPFLLPMVTGAFPFVELTSSYNWFWWYLIVVIVGNFVFRKLLGVE
jgi:uncharacterized membrane protein (DUF106 family)